MRKMLLEHRCSRCRDSITYYNQEPKKKEARVKPIPESTEGAQIRFYTVGKADPGKADLVLLERLTGYTLNIKYIFQAVGKRA